VVRAFEGDGGGHGEIIRAELSQEGGVEAQLEQPQVILLVEDCFAAASTALVSLAPLSAKRLATT